LTFWKDRMTSWKDSLVMWKNIDILERQKKKCLMNNNNKEISKEWVGAPNLETSSESMTPRGQTFTPSDRDIRAEKRNQLREMQATDAKLATATETLMISTAAKMKAKSKEFKSSKAHAINITGSKMRSTPQPEQHHRINQSPLSLENWSGDRKLNS